MIGQVISHYKILEKLGEGGMGIVYKAEDIKLHRPVALKILPRQALITEEDKTRFAREAQAAASLSHPNVAMIFEFDEIDDPVTGGKLAFIAMEYVDGETLKKRIQERPLPIPEVVNIAIAVAEGLAKAHEKGIIHRDIKSDNVMISRDGVVKIMDFGLAEVAGRTRVTKEGMTVGTVAYMSPEQALGEKLDLRTDIWSLGVVLYEMITGRLPFAGDYEQAIIYQILNEEPEPITSLRSNVPMELERIVKKAMQRNRDERYQRVEDMVVDLRSLKKESESRILETPRVKAPTRKRKLTYILGGIATVVIIIAAFGVLLFSPRVSKQEVNSIAVLPFTNIRNDPQFDFLGFALADQIIGSLSYVHHILVRPSSAIRPYQSQIVDVRTAGRDLKVDFVLAGNFLKESDLVRLNVELINVQSNEILWREAIQVNYENTFALQDIVSEKVLNGLRIQFSQDERPRIHATVPKNPLAYEYYLRAVSYPVTLESDQLAIEVLKKSISLDSTYAPAHSELGYRLHQLANYGLLGIEGYENAEKALRRALSLNEDLLTALWNLSTLYTELGKAEEAVELTKQMLRVNPNNALAHFSLSYIYRYVGMLQESEAEVEKAFALDPKNPRFRSAGFTYLYLGKYEEALKAFALDKGSTLHLAGTGLTLFLQGKPQEAIEYLDRAIAMEPEGFFGSYAGIKAAITGNLEEGLRALRKLEKSNPTDAEDWYFVGRTYGLLGDKAGCSRGLLKAIEGGFFNYPYMLRDPFLDSLRGDPEFQRVLAMAKEKHEAFKKNFFSNKP